MYQKKKGVLLFLITILVLSLLAGCGNSGNSEQSDSNSAPIKEAATPVKEETKEPVTLKLFVNSTVVEKDWGSESVYGKLLKDFEASTGTKVELSVIPGDAVEMQKKVDIALVSGDSTDLIMLSNPLIQDKYASQGFLYPMNELATKSNYDISKVFGDNVVRYEDEVYFLPVNSSVWAVFYNQKLFDDAKVPYPSGNWTWSEYVETAKKLTNPEKGIMGSYMLTFDAYMYLSARQKNVSGYKEDGTSNFDAPEFKEALKLYGDFGNVHKIQPSWLEWKTKKLPNTGFLDGKYAMLLGGSFFTGILNNTEKYPRDWKWGVTQLPTPDDGKGNNTVGVTAAIGISKNSKNPEMAFEFTKFFAENQAKARGELPSRKDLSPEELNGYLTSIAELSAGSVTADDLRTAFYDNGLGFAQEKLIGPAMTEYGNIILQEGELYLVGQKSLDETVTAIKKRMDEAIKNEAKN